MSAPVSSLQLILDLACNNNCTICGSSWPFQPNLSTEQALDRLGRGIGCGIKEVVFSGGEVTLRNDIVPLVKAARQLKYETVVVLTNGRRLSDPELTVALLEGGVTRFGLSLYGHTPELHEQVTRVPGSFAQTLQGIATIQRCSNHQTPISANCVIVPSNFRYLADMVELLVSVDIRMIQLTYVVPVGRASRIFSRPDMPTMSETMPYVHKAVELFLSLCCSTPRTSAAVAFYPFCVLSGLEPFSEVLGQAQTYFASDDGNLVPIEHEIDRQKLKVKRPRCNRCSFTDLCDGVWQAYIEARGWSEFSPVTGASK